MANTIIYPASNPLTFFIPDISRDARYNSKDFIDFVFPETILPWQQNTGFCQPWQTNDRIPLQLQSNIGPINFVLKDCHTDFIVDTVALDQKQESLNNPGLFIYELLLLMDYEPGCYYAELKFGVDPVIVTIRTGEIEIAERHDNTILAQWEHFENREDIIYETGWEGCLRVPSIKKFLGSKKQSTTYIDQVLDTSVLRAQKFREWEWLIGLGQGVPDYFADIIGGFIDCSDFRLDGKGYSVPSETEMEANEISGVAKRWWKISPIRERYNRASRIIEDNTTIEGQISVMATIDLKGISTNNSGDETLIIDVQ